MPRKPNDKSKRPIVPEQEFPRKCNQCAQKRVVMTSVSYDAEVRHDGRSYTFNVPKLEIMICEACNEKVFTGEVDSQINLAFRKHAGLLSPAEIRAGIKRIGMNQKEVSESLGLAEATLSRWLNETQIQSRAMDNLLRTFFAFPRARQILSAETRDDTFGFVEYA